MTIDVADALSRVSIFSHLKQEDLQRITKKSRFCSFKAGEIVIAEGERDRRLFILISGKVNIFKSYGTKKEKLVRTLVPPSYFGEIALLDDLARSATVVAPSNVDAICLDHLDLHQEIQNNQSIAIELLKTLNRRYLALEKILVEATGGFIPVCAGCKKIRNDSGTWVNIEQYIMDYTEYELSHVICPECRKSLRPETTSSKE
ncbi:MAG: cyclic nucleotide-binding domain-containing protein [Deltaproteobacteria bacterium]|jgi:CRP/FNR family transcriptional regulator|nr:cyclic nucleotide-binding domain-containing protein [Deltaproteobacteria bacterium]